jgi:signal transduction histidine kinase
MTPESIESDNPANAVRWDVNMTRRHDVALARWVSIGSLGLMMCLWLAILVSNGSIRDAAIDRATASASNLSAAFCEQVYDTLTSVDAAMDMTIREIRSDPTGFRLDQWAAELAALAHPTMYATLIDPTGHIVSTTAKSGLTGMDLSDREHVRVHLHGHDPGLFVSVPVVGRVTGSDTIEVTKRVEAEDGHLLGVLVFSLAPDDLTALHRLVSLGPRGVIALIGTDGRLRARFGVAPAGSVVPGATWPLMIDEGRDDEVVRSEAIDGISRLYSLRRLPSYPLIVAAGLSLDDELSDARAHGFLVVGIGFAASALLFGLNVLLLREIRRRNQREMELSREHAALEAARAELVVEQGKLADVNRELVVSSERAQAASLAKSQFLAQMSHELRTPLHAVIGFSELISHHVAPIPSAGQIAGFAADIMKSGRHLLELINSILDLSKVESGTASLAEDIVPLGEVIVDSMTTIREQAVEAGVMTGTRLPLELPRIHGDSTKLRQIFINLLSNAVKFTPRGGTVTVSARVEPDGGFAVMVEDTGIGMTDAELAIAMEPFGQVENSLARSFEGTGLGLPLAQRLTELHGGRLIVRSVKGRGTVVEVVLPGSRISWPSSARNVQDAPATSG